MSDRWTDKKRGYTGGSIPSGAQGLSFTADQRERLGGLDFLRARKQDANGNEFGVTRFGKYERGYSKEPKPKGTEKLVTFVAVAYFKGYPPDDKFYLMLLKCDKDGYTVVNQCETTLTISSAKALSSIIRMANVGVTWDVAINKYRVFINPVSTGIDGTRETVVYQSLFTYVYIVDTDGNVIDDYTIFSSLTGVGRGSIRTVGNLNNKNIPMNYYIPGINEVVQIDGSTTRKIIYSQTGVPDGDPVGIYEHYHRMWDITRNGKEMIYAGVSDLLHPNIAAVYRENLRTNEIEKMNIYASDILGYDVDDETMQIHISLKALVQGWDKIYFSEQYRPFGGDITEYNIYAADKDNLRDLTKFASYPVDAVASGGATQYKNYPLLLAYSDARKLLFVGITKITVYRGEPSESYPDGEATSAEKEVRIDVYDIDGNLLYAIPIFSDNYPDPSLFNSGLLMFEASLYGYASQLWYAPDTAWRATHTETRISIVEGIIL